MVTSPQVSWLFFKARAKRPYLSHTGRASNAEKQPTVPGPEGCVENGPAAALLVGYVSIQICALLAPCRRPILNATTSPLFARRCTSLLFAFSLSSGANVKERAGSSESRNIRSSGDRCPPWTRSGSSHAKIATNNEIFYTVSRFGSSGRLCDGNPVVAHC